MPRSQHSRQFNPPLLRLAATAAVVLSLASPIASAAQSVDTLRATTEPINGFKLKSGHTDDESFLENGAQSAPGPRSTKDISDVKCGTGDCYLIVMASTMPAGRMVDSVWADRRTFALVRHVEDGFGKHTTVDVSGGRIRGAVSDSGKVTRKIDEPAPAFDFSVVEEIVAKLPLRANYKTVVHTYDVTQGFRDVGVNVTGIEDLDTHHGKRPTWIVDFVFSTHKATRWIDRETGEGLKWQVEMAPGRRMWGRPPAR